MPAPPHRAPKGQSATLAKEYVERYPELPKLTIARIMQKENPGVFGTLNAASCAVRYVTGTMGSAHRDKKQRTRAEHRGPGDDPIDLLPEGYTEFTDYKPHALSGSTIGCLYDPHVPWHDAVALRAACRWFRDEGIDHLFLGGDVVDFYALSRWEKDPQERDLAWEMFVVREFLSGLRAVFPDIPITYLPGNHESRLRRYVFANADAIAALQQVSLKGILSLDDYRITLIPELHFAKAGHLKLIHGHEFNQRSSVNPARSLLLKARESVMCGHWHKTDDHSGGTPITRDRIYSTHAVGCLCQLRPKFMPFNEWNHGAALVRVGEGGAYQVENRRIIDGAVV